MMMVLSRGQLDRGPAALVAVAGDEIDENAKASRTKSGLEKNAGRLLARDEGMAWLDGSLDSLDSMLESHLTSKPVAWRLAPTYYVVHVPRYAWRLAPSPSPVRP